MISHIHKPVRNVILESGYRIVILEDAQGRKDAFAALTIQEPMQDVPYFQIKGFVIDFNFATTSDKVIMDQVRRLIKDKEEHTYKFSGNVKWFIIED